MRKSLATSLAAITTLSLGMGLAPTPASASSATWTKHHRMRAYHLRDIPAVDETSTATAVIVGGTPIMRFRNSAGGFTAEQRAVETQDRLNAILSTGPIMSSDITTDTVGGEGVVLVKGQLLFTADSETAYINDSTPMELAEKWADNMRNVLPGLTEAK